MGFSTEESESRLDGLAGVLAGSGWTELSPSLSFEEMVYATDFLDDVFGGGGGIGELFRFDGTEFVELRPTTLQFFYDLYGFGSALEPVDILVSYISETERQEYIRYSGTDAADIQDFFQQIHEKPAFIFQGTFAPLLKKDGTYQDVSWIRRQRTLNGICVDIDGAEFIDGKHPIDEGTLTLILEAIPRDLTPSYICLTGNGVHLWYVFSSPIQTFSRNTVRQRKLRALTDGLYRLFTLLLEGLDAEPDPYCASLNHCFRAPGSQTKDGGVVRCFCPASRVYVPSPITVPELSRIVADNLGDQFPERNVVTADEAEYKTRDRIEYEHALWVESKMGTPATERQLEFIRHLEEEGLLKDAEIASVEGMSILEAQSLIKKALNRRGEGGKAIGAVNDYSEWKTKPHWLVAGSTGGVYATVFDSIKLVPPGNRYNSLHMLAGVAYMMVRPEKTLASLTEDFMGLLKTPWARAGKPLTERDIKNALLGYNPDNRQTVGSIVRTLGFNPFGEPAKRNGRTRDEHLALVHAARSQATLARIASAIRESPNARKSEIARTLGLSRPTVDRYWDEATALAQASRRSPL